ncbi:MAG: FKBP-type peptidyl-prolyl cis-trans isomerase [Kineosporiaceae bacterium]|nr:FKBP-type peptidyl-prolyl cis-trans isomerase [Kineosporiaceae bacterium]MBK7623323.1 FKBP-type peptidyl-prolyl cis-trans isomerase [Kineosporiaceae bacterium]MBK8074725.1 FKBP-type peptidyl-prolyl cis-trans isomerase [Kineosporiaceae bacterium]
MSSGRRRRIDHSAARLLGCLVVGAAALSACGGGSDTKTASSSSAASASASASASESVDSSAAPTVPAVTGPVRETKVGVKVTGDFGQKPALTVPASAAPTTLRVEQLVTGSGATVATGQTLVANYLGQTWKPKDGKVNIFDNSYDRKAPASFQIGTGSVIKGWDTGLVGQKIGSRVLLSIPAAEAYGASPAADNPLAGEPLLFVVDIVGAVDAKAGASGTAVKPPAGYPSVTSVAGKEPQITSVKGVTASSTSRSTLLIKGTGPTIDPKKSLALQFIQTDTATGKQTQTTWGKGVEVVPAEQVFTVAEALKGARVGSRAVVVTAAAAGSESLVVVVDVVAQF